jgi:hypothetical protein
MTTREEKLRKEGWLRRSVASEPRLSEMVELYRNLGFEVRLEPLDDEEKDGGCATCFEEDPSRFCVIYTRRSADAPAGDDKRPGL